MKRFSRSRSVGNRSSLAPTVATRKSTNPDDGGRMAVKPATRSVAIYEAKTPKQVQSAVQGRRKLKSMKKVGVKLVRQAKHVKKHRDQLIDGTLKLAGGIEEITKAENVAKVGSVFPRVGMAMQRTHQIGALIEATGKALEKRTEFPFPIINKHYKKLAMTSEKTPYLDSGALVPMEVSTLGHLN